MTPWSPTERARAFFSELGEQMADGELDEASNAVVDLVHAGKLDEAEAAARELLVRFPEVFDGYDRLGMVAEARGDKKLAAAHYRKVSSVGSVGSSPDVTARLSRTIFSTSRRSSAVTS